MVSQPTSKPEAPSPPCRPVQGPYSKPYLPADQHSHRPYRPQRSRGSGKPRNAELLEHVVKLLEKLNETTEDILSTLQDQPDEELEESLVELREELLDDEQ